MNVIDAEVLNALRELEDGDDGFLGDLIDSFLQQVPASLTEIQAALARGDWAALAAHAHSLKGSSGSLGARPMFELCARLEQQARSGAPADAEALCAELEGVFPHVRQALMVVRDGTPVAISA